MIQIDTKALKRMAELHAISEQCGDDTDPKVYQEYRQLLRQTVSECLPVVQMLAKAGLFTMSVRNSPDSDPREYMRVEYAVTHAFENGNIWLCAGETVQWIEVKQPNKLFKPSEFSYDVKAYFTETGEWEGWRDFLGAPADSPICDECGYHPCKCKGDS